jgi:hypothetical protein
MTCCARPDVGRLEEMVRRRVRGQVEDLRVLVLGHGLILRGRAPTYYVKQLAQHAILGASRLPLLANEIEVAPSAEHGQCP